MKLPAKRMVSLLILVLGAAALIYGVVSFVEFRESAAGQVSGVARDLARNVVGRGNVGLTDVEKRSIGFMVGGGIGVLAGAGFLTFRKRR